MVSLDLKLKNLERSTGSNMANTRRMNRLEELGRVDAEKAFTKKGARNLRDEKKRIVRELKADGGRAKMPMKKLKDIPGPQFKKNPLDKRPAPKTRSKRTMQGLKPVRPEQKGLKKLPRKVRNKMGYMKKGGRVMSKRGMGKAMRGGGCVR